MADRDHDFDAIVIGSGMGGLAAASLLARFEGARVLVLERHFRLGGFTHEFRRGRYRWDVGLHYVGQMGRGSSARGMMDLVTGGAVDWDPMPDDFDVFHYPDITLAANADRQIYRDRLIAAFPDEEEGIDAYFADVKKAAAWVGRETFSWVMPSPLRRPYALATRSARRLATRTTAEQIGRRVLDPKLRALLASQWGDYGLPPGRSAFGIHALIVDHYAKGGWYPRGGSEAIAEAARAVIEQAGGSCRVNHEVHEILIEQGRAVGVRAHVRKGRGGSEAIFRAPLVISDAGAHTTYGRLLPRGHADRLLEAITAAGASTSAITLYLGLRESPERIGLTGANHWHFGGYDHDASAIDGGGVLDSRPSSAYLSVPSVKDRSAGAHTAEIITFGPAAAFAPWQGTEWMRRGADYEALKERIAHGLIELIERDHPGLRALIDHVEVSTPVTVETFTGHREGGIYGIAATPERFERRLVSARSPVPGLVLAGADVCSPGIVGSLMGGVFAVGAARGMRAVGRIMRAAGRPGS